MTRETTADLCPCCGRTMTVDLARTPEPAPALTGPGATAEARRRARELYEQTRREKEQAE